MHDLEIIKFIIENHCINDEEALLKLINCFPEKDIERIKRLYFIFKDSDNLDRVRLGDLDIRLS